MEVERKFLVEVLPSDLNVKKQYEIEQFYVLLEGKSECRVRRRASENGEEFFLTVKSGEGLVRTEVEVSIDSDQYAELKKTTNRGVEKTRLVTIDGFEVDLYRGPLSPLKVVEVEFPGQAESEAFVAPAWFGREVTEDKRFKNKNLALEASQG